MKKILYCTDLTHTNYNQLLRNILDVYYECHISTFPINCFSILEYYGFKVYSYKSLEKMNRELYDICKSYTNDAFTCGNIIAYNEKIKPERIRFSLMHELGHFILGLPSTKQSYEDYVDYFASNILAPRSVIWHLQCVTVKDICKTFQVSSMAATRILEDYKMCRFWEHKQLHKSTRDYFFPSDSSTAMESEASDHEVVHIEKNYDFFNTLRLCRGDKYMFQYAENQHIYGSDL